MKKNLKRACAIALLGTSAISMSGVYNIEQPKQTVFADVTESASISPTIKIERAPKTANVGTVLTLPDATFTGTTSYDSVAVSVSYNNKTIPVVEYNSADEDVSLDATIDKVVAKRKIQVEYIGQYSIKYEFTRGANKYVAIANFNGEQPDASFVSVSDELPLVVSSNFIGVNDKIVLPIPEVKNADGDVLAVDLRARVVAPNAEQTTWVYNKDANATEWTKVGASGTTKVLDLTDVITNNKLAVGNYVIKYEARIGGLLVAQSESYTFKVDSTYNFENAKFKYEYANTVTTWELGEEKELPGVNATHDGTAVNAYFEVDKVTFLENGAQIDVKSQVIKEGTKFEPNREGQYTISYKVKDYLGHISTFENNLVITVEDKVAPKIQIVEPYATNATTHVVATHKLPTKTLNENIKIYPVWAEDLGTTEYEDFKLMKIELQNRTSSSREYVWKSTNKIGNTENTFPTNKIIVFSKQDSYTLGENEVDADVELVVGNQYRVLYTVEDKAGHQNTASYDFDVTNELVYSNPTVEFTDTIFPSSIELGEKIEFNAPTFTDTIEAGDRLLKTVSYQLFKNGDYETAIILEADKDGKYVISEDDYGTASKVKIIAKAENNGGNVGTATQEIAIVSQSDSALPEIATMGVVKNSEGNTTITQGDRVVVPAITISDDLVDHISVSVSVEHINGEVVTPISNVSSTNQFSTSNTKYVFGAEFGADYKGDYRITYTITDAANNKVIQYVEFSANENPAMIIKRFKNLPVKLSSEDLELGKSLSLPTATIEHAESEVSAYVVKQIDGPDGASLNSSKFTPTKIGTYKLQYVGIIADDATELASILADLQNAPAANIIESSVYTVKVVDTTAPTIFVNDIVPATLKKNDTSFTAIPTFSANDGAGVGIDVNKSYVKFTSAKSSTITVYYKDLFTSEDMEDPALNYEEEYTLTYYVVDLEGNEATKTYKIAVGDTLDPTINLLDGILETPAELNKNLTIKTNKIEVSDDKTTDLTVEDVVITVTNTSLSKTVNALATTGDNRYIYKITEAGTYTVSFKVTDDAGHTTVKEETFTIDAEDNKGTNKTEILGTILIVVSVLVLAGVVVYFIVSKKKTDKLYK